MGSEPRAPLSYINEPRALGLRGKAASTEHQFGGSGRPLVPRRCFAWQGAVILFTASGKRVMRPDLGRKGAGLSVGPIAVRAAYRFHWVLRPHWCAVPRQAGSCATGETLMAHPQPDPCGLVGDRLGWHCAGGDAAGHRRSQGRGRDYHSRPRLVSNVPINSENRRDGQGAARQATAATPAIARARNETRKHLVN